MKFESLPNEIFIECFEYFECFEIFHSFDQLNYRFNQLIRNISLHLNYQRNQKLLFDKFCMKMLSEPEIKNQIYSLKISNKNSCDPIQSFLAWFSLDEFHHLQTLALTEVGQNNLMKLKSMLPLLSQLSDFRFTIRDRQEGQLLSFVPISKLYRLSVDNFSDCIKPVDQPCIITHITLSNCYLHNIYKVLENVPLLKYLNLQNLSANELEDHVDFPQNYQFVHLKRMIMRNYRCNFEAFESFSAHTSNLQYLTMTADYNDEMIDAPRWEHLINTSLLQLNCFNFMFSSRPEDEILDNFKQFQNDFWHQQHHWYTDYAFNQKYAVIHTIPLIQNELYLTTSSIKYQLNKLNKFDNVKDLCLFYTVITNQSEYYFPNVTSLAMRQEFRREKGAREKIAFEFLPSIVNLSDLQYLLIFDLSVEDIMAILLVILRKTSRLLSLSLGCFDMESFIKNDELCKYLNKTIVALDLVDCYAFNSSDEVRQFCEIFSNIKQLKYKMREKEDLLYLLNNLSHLSMLEIRVPASGDPENFLNWFKKQKLKSNATYHIAEVSTREQFPIDNNEKRFCIWIESTAIRRIL